MIQLFEHQKTSVSELNRLFEINRKLLLQLPTGAGKTFVFSFFVKEWVAKHPEAKVLILVHREELLKQSAKSLRSIDVTVETLTSNKKEMNHNSSAYVAMVETAVNRLKKDPEYFKDITLVIADECHLLLFERVFLYFQESKIMGVTATPSSYKKINFCKCSRCGNVSDNIEICCGIENYEYTRRFTFSEMYDEIISPVQVSELQEMGLLVKEVNYSVGDIDRSKLIVDAKTGDFDTKSSDEAFANSGSLIDVVLNYEKICLGKKTLIFNNSTNTNLLVFEEFQKKGYDNVKMLDSVNKCESRSSTLKWFAETKDAILLNCGILTAGFDQDDIEVIMMNRATTSLMLYIQIVGRGARTTDAFFKDNFLFIDLGGNIEAHGKFSDNVDWVNHFYGSDEKPRPKKEAMDQTKLCENCECLIAKSSLECEECGFVFKDKPERKEQFSSKVAQLIDDIPLPNGNKISKYCHKNKKDMAFAYKILINQCVDLFIYKYVARKTYENTLDNGKFYDALKRILSKPMKTFFVSGLEKCAPKSFEVLCKSIKSRLDKHYNIPAEEIKEITIITKI